MGKSKIINELANGEISLERALIRLIVLAKLLKLNDLKLWATKEFNGYDYSDITPPYRMLKSTYFIYSGINGNFQINRQSLPITCLSKKTADEFSFVKIHDTISSIVKKANTDEKEGGILKIDRTFLAKEVAKIHNKVIFNVARFHKY